MPLERKPDGKVKKDEYDGRRSEHVVFVPWEGADAQEWVDKTNQWNSVKAQWNVVGDGQVVQEGHFEIITYDHAIPHHPTLARIGGDPRAVIYIRGHGNPGEEYIQVKMLGTENTKKLPIIDACQRLIDMGLPSVYPGVIKFYSCHSGTKLIKSALVNAKPTSRVITRPWPKASRRKRSANSRPMPGKDRRLATNPWPHRALVTCGIRVTLSANTTDT
jgi:hypothetical protein